MQKRIAAINDISGFGKCSLTVALPIISATGIEVCVIPTAVLSTHTGEIDGYTFRDLTDDIMPIANHWKSLNIKFDAIYTGYLGSYKQLKIVEKTIEKLKATDTFLFVDPVMADNGVLYKSFSSDFPEGMKKLCKIADVITPNITEACLLTGEKYMEGPYTKEYIEKLLQKLTETGAKNIVLTGVYFDNENLGAACWEKETGTVSYSFSKKIDGIYPGTGDVFGSALLSAILNDFKMPDAVNIAVNFTANCILRTKMAGTDPRFGVNFEAEILNLLKLLNKI